MKIWNKPVRTYFDDGESLSGPPSGGRITMWLVGVALSAIPIWYGVRCILMERAALIGSRGSRLELYGADATILGIAYIAVGAFCHFHWFWGLQPRLQALSDLGKVVSLLIFLPSFGYAIYKIILSFRI